MITTYTPTVFGIVPKYTNTLADNAYDFLVEKEAIICVTRHEFRTILEEILNNIDEAVTVCDLTAHLEKSLPGTEPIRLEYMAIELLRN